MPHFMDFAAWFWSIGESVENAHLYLRPGQHIHLCDLRAEMARWDRMFDRDMRLDSRGRFDDPWETQDEKPI